MAMCIEGKQLSSEELSAMLDNAAITGKSTVDFIIGGSYGLSNKVKNRADFKLSMSKMTFPHQMARMVLSEQIYVRLKFLPTANIINRGKRWL